MHISTCFCPSAIDIRSNGPTDARIETAENLLQNRRSASVRVFHTGSVRVRFATLQGEGQILSAVVLLYSAIE